MSEDIIRRHLRAALDEIITREKAKLKKIRDDAEESIKKQIEKMSSVFEALKILNKETGKVQGLEIKLGKTRNIATIRAKNTITDHSLSISATTDKKKFRVEERQSFSFDSDHFEHSYEFESEVDVMKMVVEMVGKHIASHEIVKKRYIL